MCQTSGCAAHSARTSESSPRTKFRSHAHNRRSNASWSTKRATASVRRPRTAGAPGCGTAPRGPAVEFRLRNTFRARRRRFPRRLRPTRRAAPATPGWHSRKAKRSARMPPVRRRSSATALARARRSCWKASRAAGSPFSRSRPPVLRGESRKVEPAGERQARMRRRQRVRALHPGFRRQVFEVDPYRRPRPRGHGVAIRRRAGRSRRLR